MVVRKWKRLISKPEWQFPYNSVKWMKYLPFGSRPAERKEGVSKINEINEDNIYFLRHFVTILEWVCQSFSPHYKKWITRFRHLLTLENGGALLYKPHVCVTLPVMLSFWPLLSSVRV